MSSGFGKFLSGIVKFRQTVRSGTVKKLQEIKKHGHPAAVFFTCMDARMAPLGFTMTEIGDTYVVRNGGNMIPNALCYGPCGDEVVPSTEPAALDLTVKRGKIKHAVVCGHSDCKAMEALHNMHTHPKDFNEKSPLEQWVRRNGYQSLQKLDWRLGHGPSYKLQFAKACPNYSFTALIDPEEKYGVKDKLSQINTLQQVENITTHGFLKEILDRKEVNLHAFWFEIETGEMHLFSRAQERFVVVSEDTVNELINEVNQFKA